MSMIALAFVAFSASSVENVVVDGIDFDVFTPSTKVTGDVLVLPGWDSTKTNWCEKQNGLCDEAERRGLRLVMPEMAKSVYADRIYAETTATYRKQITRTQLEDALSHLQRDRHLLADASSSFCIGRSTGGRGCVLLALDHPEWFRAVASLSGDFDQAKMPDDALMTAAYGSFAKFPQRWHGSENPLDRVDELAVPLYLGHGARDRMVPTDQTRMFAKAARDKHRVDVVEHIDEAGEHNHAYWKRELAPVFDFFAKSPDPIERAKAAFAALQKLDGDYTAHEPGNADSNASFVVDAHGTAIVQRSGFVAVFDRDGAAIVCRASVDDGWTVTMRAIPRTVMDALILDFRIVGFENTTTSPLSSMSFVIAPSSVEQRWLFASPLSITFTRKPR